MLYGLQSAGSLQGTVFFIPRFVMVQLVSYLSDDAICLKETALNFTGASCLSTLVSRGKIQQLCFKIVAPFQCRLRSDIY